MGLLAKLIARIFSGFSRAKPKQPCVSCQTSKVKTPPKPAKDFKPPTNPPQRPTIPPNYVKESIPGGGVVYRLPGTSGNANTIRVMPPTSQYPKGYWVQYNKSGQPINVATGRTGTRPETHIPLP